MKAAQAGVALRDSQRKAGSTAPRRTAMVSDFSTEFAGRSWWVRDGDSLDPNANTWRSSGVNVDEHGLHLRIAPVAGCGSAWSSAEVWAKDALGYGT